MTLNVVLALLFAASVAVHVIVVVPIANREPGGGAHVAVPGGSTLSDVTGSVYMTAMPDVEVACALSSTCGAMVGGVTSGNGLTTTLNVV